MVSEDLLVAFLKSLQITDGKEKLEKFKETEGCCNGITLAGKRCKKKAYGEYCKMHIPCLTKSNKVQGRVFEKVTAPELIEEKTEMDLMFEEGRGN